MDTELCQGNLAAMQRPLRDLPAKEDDDGNIAPLNLHRQALTVRVAKKPRIEGEHREPAKASDSAVKSSSRHDDTTIHLAEGQFAIVKRFDFAVTFHKERTTFDQRQPIPSV